MTQHTVLIVDDESTVREVVRRYLEAEGFRVIEANTGPMALHMLHQDRPDLIVLDIMLPGLDGFTITRSIRAPVEGGGEGVNTVAGIPIVMLTARTDEADRIAGFELGTDDYVTKPFSPRELVMRIKAVLRRSTGEADVDQQSITAGELKLDANSRTLMRGDWPIALTAKEFELLWYLAQHPRQVFNRAQLLDQVWGYEFFGDGSTVTVHIHRLREKIETDPSKPEYLHTVWGVGYKFEAPA